MLNELDDLARSMQDAGIEPQVWHKQYKRCPTGNDTYIVYVGPNGSVGGLRRVEETEDISKMRKYEKANGYSFPAFNVAALGKAETETAQKAMDHLSALLDSETPCSRDALEEAVNAVLEQCENLWERKADRITSCLAQKSLELGDRILPAPERFKAIEELINRASQLDAATLRAELRGAVLRQMVLHPDSAKDLSTTLLATTRATAPNVTLMLELSDWQEYDYPTDHEKCRKWINRRLCRDQEDRSDAEEPVEDAFGKDMAGARGKLPHPTLPVLGQVTLRAMSTESPCQKRYGRGDEQSFPAGTATRRSLAAALEWLADRDRQGKTWESVSNACYGSAVLFAYPSILSPDPPELAGLIGGPARDSGAVKFEAAAEVVIGALRALRSEHPEAHMSVFVLRKRPGDARTKVLVSRRFRAVSLIDGAREWRRNASNIPPIAIQTGTEASPNWVTPRAPFPAEAVECLNVVWLEGGRRSAEVEGLNIGDGLRLLLDSGRKVRTTARRALHLALENATSFLLSLGQADHRREGRFRLRGRRMYQAAGTIPALLGLLLAKLEIRKGEYMDSAPYLVGRLLSLADTLHKEYCRSVREGQTPPRLIGNSLMSTAVDRPQAGLARLHERITVYQGWADTAGSSEARLAKWALARMGEVAQDLGQLSLPESTTDADKAQMLLGYLASWSSKDVGSGQEDSNASEEAEDGE